MQLVTGNAFKDLCDAIYPERRYRWKFKEHNDPFYYFTEGHNLKDCVEFCGNVKDEIVIVSHNSDANILDHEARDFDYHFIEFNIPSNVKMIFAQNLNVLSDKIRPIGIGLENYKWHQGDKWKEIESIIPQKFERQKYLYINHSIPTNPKEREEPYRIFKNKGFATLKNKVSYIEYLTDLKQHKFRLCPFGNGGDTHSIWESLYCGCVPVVKKAVFTQMFARFMPMVVVEDWNQINLEFLKREYHRIISNKLVFGNDYLEMPFWEKVIKGEIKIC